jgi:cytochrome b561
MKDSQQRYGTISRFFHWTMALGFFWMAATVILKVVADETGIQKFFWSTHKAIGFLLLIMIALRTAWLFITLKDRPASFSLPAKLGHIALYLLMLAVPAIGFLRQFGSGKPFEVFGVKILEASDTKYQWMIDLGGSVHGLFGWCLFVLAAGHIIMALIHHFGKDKDLMKRMI